jgi:hypothetical protein
VDLIAGLFALAIGVGVAAGGYRLFRLLLPFIGFAIGFLATAQLIGLILNEGFLASTITIIGAIIGGLALAWVAYAVWWLGVVLAFGGIGFALGFAILPALGVAERDLLNILIGVGAGVGLAAVAVVLKLPRVLVIAATGVWGAAVAVAGVMVLLNVVDPDQLQYGGMTAVLRAPMIWIIAWIAAAIAGMVFQWASTRDYELLPSGADIVASDEAYQSSRQSQPPPDMRGMG